MQKTKPTSLFSLRNKIRKLKLRGAKWLTAVPYTGCAISCSRKHLGLVWAQSQVQHSASVACGKKERQVMFHITRAGAQDSEAT